MTPDAGGEPGAFSRRSTQGDPRGDRAASEVVGNILMIGVTVLLAGALAISLSQATAPSDPVSADLVVVDGSDLEVRHAGGESIPVDGPVFVLAVDGTDERHPLSDFSSDVAGGSPSLWEIGERVCLSCSIAGTISEINFVAQEEVILSWERNP